MRVDTYILGINARCKCGCVTSCRTEFGDFPFWKRCCSSWIESRIHKLREHGLLTLAECA
eukprot:3076945-Amphidinium_carterae.1